MPYYYSSNFSIILILASFLVTLVASIFVRANYKKYKGVSINCQKSGYDVAREILDKNNLKDVLILETPGDLTDHYDPSKKVIKLSTDIYRDSSIASCSVAAHECGHAIQDKEGYKFLRFRNRIVPLVNFSSKAGYIAIMIGLIFSLIDLVWVGIFLELIILFFQLVTLPVEFNASSRALANLQSLSIINSQELDGSKKMLKSAAFTYVAGVLANILQLLRLVLIASSRDDR